MEHFWLIYNTPGAPWASTGFTITVPKHAIYFFTQKQTLLRIPSVRKLFNRSRKFWMVSSEWSALLDIQLNEVVERKQSLALQSEQSFEDQTVKNLIITSETAQAVILYRGMVSAAHTQEADQPNQSRLLNIRNKAACGSLCLGLPAV